MHNKRIAVLSLLVVMISIACLGTGVSGPGATGSATFATPEDAISHYIAGVAEANPAKILQACAVDEMAEGFRFDLYTESLRTLLPALGLAPADHPLYVESNRAQLTSRFLTSARILVYSLLSDENVEGDPIVMDAERISVFMADVKPDRLTGLTLVKAALPDKTAMDDPRYSEIAARSAGYYSADESTERVALLSFEATSYFVGFTLLRYGDNWKVSANYSALADTHPLGAAREITVDEFEAQFGGN